MRWWIFFVVGCATASSSTPEETVVEQRRLSEEAPARPAASAIDEALPRVDSDVVTTLIVISPRHGEIQMRRSAGTWIVERPLRDEADSSAVRTALDKLESLVPQRLVTDDSAHHARLEVNGLRVRALDDSDVVIDLYVGTFVSGDTMVRLEGSDVVHAVRGSIKFAFNKPLRDWRDRRVVDVDPTDATEIHLVSPDADIVLEQRAGVWSCTADCERAPAADHVPALVNMLARLRATGFGDLAAPQWGDYEVALSTPDTTVHLDLSTNVLPDGGRFARRRGDDTIYALSRYAGERLTLATPTPPSAATTPPAATTTNQNIPPDVMRQIERQLRQQQQNP